LPKELTQLSVTALLAISKPANPAATNFFDFHLPKKPTLFIKQGEDILAEASTQHLFSTLAHSNP
jgi:hypothetical protein